MVFARLFCAVGLLSVAFAAYGQLLTQRKPGLWELQYTLEGAQAEAEQQRMTERLKSMPPERRAQMEAAMAQRGTGMTLGPDGKPIVKMRFCLTAEEVLQESRGLLKGRRRTPIASVRFCRNRRAKCMFTPRATDRTAPVKSTPKSTTSRRRRMRST